VIHHTKRGSSALILCLILLAGALPAAAQTAYAVRSDGSTAATDDFLYAIDLATGVATPIGNTGFEDVESLAFNPGCTRLYGVDDVTDQLLTCDLDTGACTPVGRLGVNITDTGLAFGPGGVLYMSTDSPRDPTNFYQVSSTTGAARRIGDQGQEVTALGADATTLFGLGGDGANNLVRIPPGTGNAREIGPLGSAVTLVDAGLDLAADGTLYGIHDGSTGRVSFSQIFTVSRSTGAATVVAAVRASSGTNLDGFESLAILDGICAAPRARVIMDIPTASEWGLAALVLSLAAVGIAVLRRGA
jgi:hypothetical protein